MKSRTITKKALIASGGPLVILAPHPDDELFGCALLVAAARRSGVRILIVVLTDGRGSHPLSVKWPPGRLIALRRSETRRGLARLGARTVQVRFLGWRDGELATQGSVLRLRAVLNGFSPSYVLVSSPRDFHADHQAAYALAIRAVANTRAALATYEVWSRVGAKVHRARDGALARKRWAAAAHRSQLGGFITDDPSAFNFDVAALNALVTTSERYQAVSVVKRSRLKVRPVNFPWQPSK